MSDEQHGDALDALDAAFAAMLARQPPARRRRTARARRIALAAATATLAVSSIAGAARLTGVWTTDEPAGDPPDGRFELKLHHGGETYALLTWRPAADRLCYEAGRQAELSRYPLRDGGSCFDTQRVWREPGFTASRSSTGNVTLVTGVAGPAVDRITITQRGDARQIELSERSRAFMTVVESGPVEVRALLRDGTHASIDFPDPPAERSSAIADAVPVTEGPRIAGDLAVVPPVGGPTSAFWMVVRKPARPIVYRLSVTGPGGERCRQEITAVFGLGPTAWDVPAPSGYVTRPLFDARLARQFRDGGEHLCEGRYVVRSLATSPGASPKRMTAARFEVRRTAAAPRR